MAKYQLLDCTLRDGAYVVDGQFRNEAMRGVINKLQDSGVDIIECGWLKNAPHVEGSSFFHVPEDLARYLVSPKRKGCVFTAMIDWDRYDLSALPPCDGQTIDAIRVVFPKNHFREGIALGCVIRDKGYRVYFQAANTLGYTDRELLEMIEAVNEARPDSLSIVDTFGAMYPQDLKRIAALVDHNLDSAIHLGFHSHNNLQLSFGLGIEFLRCLAGTRRGLIVDSSLCGMGRGAGNLPTELIADFMNKSCGGSYDIDRILDAIDMYMSYFLQNYSWGYSVPYYISGTLCAHVNNIAYLTKTHRTNAHDMKAILESIDCDKRLTYDYDNLEAKYTEYQSHKCDDSRSLAELAEAIRGRELLLLSPGESVVKERAKIDAYIARCHPLIVGVNAAFPGIPCDYLFFSSALRLEYARETNRAALAGVPLLVTSNVRVDDAQASAFNYSDYVKHGWKYFDNSAIICMRILQKAGAKRIALAGFDGYHENGENNYSDPVLQTQQINRDERAVLNREVSEMLRDFQKSHDVAVCFLTSSRYAPTDEGKA